MLCIILFITFNSMKEIPQSILDKIAQTVHDAGIYAKKEQNNIHISYKHDGSVLTEVDLAISTQIIETITLLLPEANIINEEIILPLHENAPYTFVLDPIDGTDVYSQGLPCYAIALGLLDEHYTPVGSYISAPRFGVATDSLCVRLDPGKKLLVNGQEFHALDDKDQVRQITISSKGQKHLDFSHYSGKVRTFGSTILHLLSPVLFSGIQASIAHPAFIWDIASAHAVLLSQGMDFTYADGSPFIYDNSFVREREHFRMPLYAGTEKGRTFLREHLPYLHY